jgi:thiol-disulfide isomerase/thioredoxin
MCRHKRSGLSSSQGGPFFVVCGASESVSVWQDLQGRGSVSLREMKKGASFGMRPFRVTLFTKEGCTLCEKVKPILERVGRTYPLEVAEFDITTDEAVYAKYWDKIPVLHVDGEEAFVSKIAEHWLRRYLEEKMQSRIE